MIFRCWPLGLAIHLALWVAGFVDEAVAHSLTRRAELQGEESQDQGEATAFSIDSRGRPIRIPIARVELAELGGVLQTTASGRSILLPTGSDDRLGALQQAAVPIEAPASASNEVAGRSQGGQGVAREQLLMRSEKHATTASRARNTATGGERAPSSPLAVSAAQVAQAPPATGQTAVATPAAAGAPAPAPAPALAPVVPSGVPSGSGVGQGAGVAAAAAGGDGNSVVYLIILIVGGVFVCISFQVGKRHEERIAAGVQNASVNEVNNLRQRHEENGVNFGRAPKARQIYRKSVLTAQGGQESDSSEDERNSPAAGKDKGGVAASGGAAGGSGVAAAAASPAGSTSFEKRYGAFGHGYGAERSEPF